MNIARRALLVAAVALVAEGCARTGKDQESVLHRRLEGEPKTLNPLLITSDPDLVVLSLVSRNLVDWDEKLAIVPGLAEAIDEDASHRVFTVRLRKDARWEDGTPVTSADVVTTIRAIVDPKTPALRLRSFFDDFEKAEAVDASTARVTFKAPYAERLQAFTLQLLPASAYTEGSDVTKNPRNRQPLANGPYRLARWTPGQTIELVRNTQYFGGKSPAERVVFHVVPESAAALQGLLAGSIGESRLSYEQKTRVDSEGKSGRPVKSIVWDDLAYTYLGWDNRSPRFSDRRVRQALSMLVDREGMAKTLYGGLAHAANGPIPRGLWTWDASLAPWPYDPARAEALLDEAGFVRGKDGVRAKGSTRLAFDLSYGAGSDLQRQIVETAQQSFRKAGVGAALRPMEWAAFSEAVDAGKLEAFALSLSMDPNPDLTMMWHSSQAPPNGLNSVFYGSPDADALMERLRGTFDRAQAKDLYAKLQRVIHEDEPVTFLHDVSVKWGLDSRIDDVKTSPYGLFLFWPGGSSWRPGRVKAAI